MSAWIDKIFEAQQVQDGGTVRRSVADVIQYASIQELIDEVKIRGFHMVQVGDQFVIICNPGLINLIC